MLKLDGIWGQPPKHTPYLSAGASLTYIPNYHSEFGGYKFHEYTLRSYLNFRLLKRFSQGLDFQYVYTESPLNGNGHHYLLGVMSQFDILKSDAFRTYAEAGYYTGNYCTCENGRGEPFKKQGLLYPSLGAGIEIQLIRQLHLDLAFSHKYVSNVSKSEYRYRSFNIYILGLNYRFLPSHMKK